MMVMSDWHTHLEGPSHLLATVKEGMECVCVCVCVERGRERERLLTDSSKLSLEQKVHFDVQDNLACYCACVRLAGGGGGGGRGRVECFVY